MDKLVECVPNFSEGRDKAVLRGITEMLSYVKGAQLLDCSADPDHNRSVFTVLGEPEAVCEAVFKATSFAFRHIDLSWHEGEHPYIGVADVIPFVPYRNMTMAEAVQLAETLGQKLADKIHIPVYLYEEAARDPRRKNLADIRRGGFDGLEEKMADPFWKPDFGPCAPHPTFGAAVVGARWFLIAYNVNLNCNNINVAKEIAKKIRQSSGGLPHVKAIAIDLAGKNMVQVSCNLTDYRVTPIHVVFEAIKKEAAALGVEVVASEIIGLPPMAAIAQTAGHYLELPGFTAADILEDRMLNSE